MERFKNRVTTALWLPILALTTLFPWIAGGCGSTVGTAGSGSGLILLTSNVTGTLANPIGHDNVFVLNANGTLTNLTHFSGGDEDDPHFSPDGRTIVFTRKDSAGVRTIWRMRADGTNPQQIVPAGLSSANPDDPSFGPDGSQILFIAAAGASSGIALMGLDGSNARRVGPASVFALTAAFSPDGRSIVFEGWNGPTTGFEAIFLMNADGTNVRPLTVPTNAHHHGPRFSRDGTHIAFFASGTDPVTQQRVENVFVMNADGRNIQQLSTDGKSSHPVFTGAGKIVFTSGRTTAPGTANEDVFIMNADGSNVIRLTTSTASGAENTPSDSQ